MEPKAIPREARAKWFKEQIQGYYRANKIWNQKSSTVFPNSGEIELPPLSPARKDFVPVVKVVNADTLETAREEQERNPDLKMAVLNMASNFKPGGGAESGALAQEESLFYRTDYCTFMDKKWYPLDGKLIYSEGVSVVADSRLELLKGKDRIKLNFIAAAAPKDPDSCYVPPGGGKTGIRDPALWGERYLYETDERDMSNRIDRLFRVAIHSQCTVLVLGALGCGAYHNPADHVMELFRKSIHEYGAYFDRIVFAILETKSAKLNKIFSKLCTSEKPKFVDEKQEQAKAAAIPGLNPHRKQEKTAHDETPEDWGWS